MMGSGVRIDEVRKNVAVNDKGEVNGSASQVPIMNGVLQADITVSGTVKDKKANLLIDVLTSSL